MALTPLSADLNNVQKFDNYPSDDTSPADIKATFDKAGNDIKTYINGTLIPQVDAKFTDLSAVQESGSAETPTTIGGLINASNEMPVPANTDMVAVMNTAAGNVLNKLSWANVKATAKTYFDTLYAALTHTHGSITNDGKVGSMEVRILGTGTGGAVETKTAQQAADILKISNKNLLHNWDFLNPVNQRGTVSYSSAGYTIDRWVIPGAYGNFTSITPGANGITFISPGIRYWGQLIEGAGLAGKTCAVSLKINGVVHTAVSAFPVSLGDSPYVQVGTSDIYVSLQNPATTYMALYLKFSTATYSNIEAIKLELGSVSTLANDPPADFGEQLALCQRYYVALNATGFTGSPMTANAVLAAFRFPVSMRVAPTIAQVDVISIYGANSGLSQTQTSVAFTLAETSPTGFSGHLYNFPGMSSYLNQWGKLYSANAAFLCSADL